MGLEKINGHTYYCPGPTNIGVVRYKSGLVALIDAGIDGTAAKAMTQTLEKGGFKPKHLIITHAHPDHFGGTRWLKEHYPGLLCYASTREGHNMAYPETEGQHLFGARPLRELEGRSLKGPVADMDETLVYGQLDLGEKRFEIIPLPGHVYDQVGVLTEDGVLFAGDSLFSEEIMAKYPFPFLLDVEAQLATIDRLANINTGYVVLSHSGRVYSSIAELCSLNKARIEEFIFRMLEWCFQPLTREDIVEKVILQIGREADLPAYYRTYATVGAFLAYLANRSQLDKSVIDGKLYFYQN